MMEMAMRRMSGTSVKAARRAMLGPMAVVWRYLLSR
jgi:hypothetical protein